MGQDGNKRAIKRQLWKLLQGRFTTFTRTKFLDRKPTPTLLQALGRVTSYRKFHRDEYSSSVPRCFQAVGNLSSNCVHETCGARWLCLPLCWLLSVTHWGSLLPGMPSHLDHCLFICEEGPGTVFPFSSLSRADAFVKHNNKLLGNWNEKAKNTKMQTLFLVLRNKHEITPSNCYQNFWNLTLNFCRVPVSICRLAQVHRPRCLALVLMSRARGVQHGKADSLREHPRLLPGVRPSGETERWRHCNQQAEVARHEVQSPVLWSHLNKAALGFNLGRRGCVPPI